MIRLILISSFIMAASAYDERTFTCLAPFLEGADTTEPANFDVAFFAGPWAPPCEMPNPQVPAFGTFTNDSAHAWFGEGLTRVHLFDPVGAEAAFRQVITLEPDAPTGYFGLTLANTSQPGRAAFFLGEAKKRLANRATLTPVERKLMLSWSVADPAPALEDLARQYPDHVTLQALHIHCVILDDVSGRRPIANRLANDLQLQRLPTRHPAIALQAILWRKAPRPEVLASVLGLTTTLPDRPQVWQLAADAHAAAGKLNDAIALAEEALTRSTWPPNLAPMAQLLTQAGRFSEATNICMQMVGMPAKLQLGGASAPDTGLRLLATACLSMEQDRALLEACQTPAVSKLPRGSSSSMMGLFYQGLALLLLERKDEAQEILDAMKGQLTQFGARDQATRTPALLLRELLQDKVPPSELLPALVRCRLFLRINQPERAKDALAKSGAVSWLSQAWASDLAWRHGDPRVAMQGFTRTLQQQACSADDHLPLLTRLDALASQMKLDRWRTPRPPQRVSYQLQFPSFPAFELHRQDGSAYTFAMTNRPVILNFFVGIACPACIVQLTRFAPYVPGFEKDGIHFLSITPNSPAALAATGIPLDLHSDTDGDGFRAFSAHDHFMNRPLHATILVDVHSRILWSYVSESPFDEPELFRDEIDRLLQIHSGYIPEP